MHSQMRYGPCDLSGPCSNGRHYRFSTVSTGSLESFTIDGNWISARAELEAFVGVMILTESDWTRPPLSGVLASDASLTGYEVAQSFWSFSDVAAVGRVLEVRWSCGAVPARRHAFERAGFRVDSRSREVLHDFFGRPISLDPELAEIIASE